MIAFTIAISMAAACLCALSPAVQLASGSLGSFLQGRVRSHTAEARAGLLLRVFMAGEVALAVALVAIAGLLMRSLLQLQRVNPGFRAENVLAMSFDLTASAFRGPGNQQPYFHELMTRIAALPGVRMVGAVSEVPLSRRRMPDQPVTLEGLPLRSAIPRAIASHENRESCARTISEHFHSNNDARESFSSVAERFIEDVAG